MRERNYEGAKVAVLINNISCRGQEPDWLEKEIQRCKDYCVKRKWELSEDDIYIEDNVSGLADMSNRPELRKLLANAEEQGYDVVLVPEMKHLGRNIRAMGDIVENILDKGMEIWMADDDRFHIDKNAYNMVQSLQERASEA